MSGLEDGGSEDRARERTEEGNALPGDDLVDEELARGGKGQGGDAAREEQQEAEGEAPPLVAEKVPDLAPGPARRRARGCPEAEHGSAYLNPDLTLGVAAR